MFRFSKYHLVFLPLLAGLLVSAWLRPVWYDDAGHYLVIEQGMETGVFCHPTDIAQGICSAESPFITLGAPLNHLYTTWMGIFGQGMGSARLLTILFSLLAFWALFDLVRRHFSGKKAFWALLLLAGNIQILSYGSQLLGEMPAMAGVFWGMNLFLRWEKERKIIFAGLAVLAWVFAVFCKAYFALPIGLGLAAWWVASIILKRSHWGVFLTGAAFTGLVILGMILEQGGWAPFVEYLQGRGSYSSEFLVFDLVEGFRFLALKPLFWLGTAAMVIRIYFQRRAADGFILSLHASLILFFLASAGYDRFGMLLLFLPAIYLAEFCLSLWKRWQGQLLLQTLFSLLFLVLFVQQTPMIWARDWPGRAVREEQFREKVSQEVPEMERIFTYDQHLAHLLDIPYRLPNVVPSNKTKCIPLDLQEGEFLIAGPYATTEYQNCIPWDELILVTEIEDDWYPCKVYQKK